MRGHVNQLHGGGADAHRRRALERLQRHAREYGVRDLDKRQCGVAGSEHVAYCAGGSVDQGVQGQ